MFFLISTPLWLAVIIWIIYAIAQSHHRKQAAQAVMAAQREIERSSKKCPMCAEIVKIEARICRHCGHHFDEASMVAISASKPIGKLEPYLLYGPGPLPPKRPSLGNS